MMKTDRKHSALDIWRLAQSTVILYLASGLGHAGARPLRKARDQFSTPCKCDLGSSDDNLPALLLDAPRLVGRSAAGRRVAKALRHRDWRPSSKDEDAAANDTSIATLVEMPVFTTRSKLDVKRVKSGWLAAAAHLSLLRQRLEAVDSFLITEGVAPHQSVELLEAVVRLEAHLQRVLVNLSFPGPEHFEFVHRTENEEEFKLAEPGEYNEIEVVLAESTQEAEELCADIDRLFDRLPNIKRLAGQVAEFKQQFIALSRSFGEANDSGAA